MIAALRKEQGMTQLELAEKMWVTDNAVSKWERDLSFPDVNSLPKLAESFHVSVDELMQVEGIGQKRAQSILDYRNQKGRISSMEELLEIDGIGEVLLSRLSEKFYAE